VTSTEHSDVPGGGQLSGTAPPPRPTVTRCGLTYGAGAMAAANRGDRLMWALHRAALMFGVIPAMPAMACAEGWRQAGENAEATRHACEWFAAGIEVESLTAASARLLGELGLSAGVHDPVAVAVVECAARRGHATVTGRSAALADVASALGHDLVAHAI